MGLMFSKAKQLGLDRPELDWPLRNAATKAPKELRKRLRERLYDVWSLLVRRRDKKCAVPKCKNKKLEGHHVVAKGHCNNQGLFALDNGMSLCYDHHHNHTWINRCPEEYHEVRDAWLKERGLSYDKLRLKYAVPGGMLPDAAMITLYHELQAQLKGKTRGRKRKRRNS